MILIWQNELIYHKISIESKGPFDCKGRKDEQIPCKLGKKKLPKP